MYDFELVRPGSIAEAASAMAGEEAQALGGGQTLIPTLKQRWRRYLVKHIRYSVP